MATTVFTRTFTADTRTFTIEVGRNDDNERVMRLFVTRNEVTRKVFEIDIDSFYDNELIFNKNL